LESHFDYEVAGEVGDVRVGSCVLVDFANRPVVGYVVGLAEASAHSSLKPVKALLGGPYFSEQSASTARWISEEYICPLSEAVRLFLPPGGTPRAVRDAGGSWTLKRPGVGPVDDRWAIPEPECDFVPKANATMQRAVLDALASGPVRVAELAADLGSVDGALKALSKAGAVRVEKRRRLREAGFAEKPAPVPEQLSQGQRAALKAISETVADGGGVVALDGVTGSGKTEVYLQAITGVLESGGSGCVLVPEISLTPQTVGRFRSRFGDDVAVLHSRLSAGERFDQWERVRSGDARVVVGARSALFAPLEDLKLIVIDEEHESSYKQGSAPRYHAREVAERLARLSGATVVLGSASLSMETRRRCDTGAYRLVELPERVTGRGLPPVTLVDMANEFSEGHRSMFSRPLLAALTEARERAEKAVVLLNRRGFASFLLCRECGHVPRCGSCATSMTFHETGSRLMCHHCGSTRPVPGVCPVCSSPYLRQFGAGTQRVEAELNAALPGWPVVRMDADTTQGKGAHERLLAAFEGLESGVLLGTQMIAKGLDYPEVTLVGVASADVTLNVPDFRAGERTYQLLEQVAGRAGRGERPGRVYVQTYWPDHPAIMAACNHDPEFFYSDEREARSELGYPPYGRMANILVWGRDAEKVKDRAAEVCELAAADLPEGWCVLGPSPAALARLKGAWRWHILVKAPEDSDLPAHLRRALAGLKTSADVSVAVDIDPVDLL
jgi:primosomal protein N' (replication factor Y)